MSKGLHLVRERQAAVLRLLIVSRETAVLAPLWAVGEANCWQLETATSGWGAMERVQAGITPDLLVLDLPCGDKDALHFLRWLRRLRPDLPIVALCDREDRPTQQEAVRLGARDCIVKPFEKQLLESAIRAQLVPAAGAQGEPISSDDVAQISENASFISASPTMRKLRAQVELLAETDSPVLILGEKGSGKETTAMLIHQMSLRSGFKFAKVNCAALPSDLLESELFGSTGNGNGTKPGKLELCDRGTILLDEIAEMPMGLQSKLLQVLQTKRFTRPGSGTAVPANVRILASSTNAFTSAISDNKLREDLCYSLSGYTVRVPPLRERREELPLFLHYFMRRMAKQYGLTPRNFSAAVLEACQAYAWPGNLRELENFVKRFLLAAGKKISFANETEPQAPEGRCALPAAEDSLRAQASEYENEMPGQDSLKSLVQTVKLEAERNAIAAALQTTGWNRKAAARLLKVSYRSLLYKIDQYQMKSPDRLLVPGSAGPRLN
jgi:two-component system, NtrC family, response regulator AtoC